MHLFRNIQFLHVFYPSARRNKTNNYDLKQQIGFISNHRVYCKKWLSKQLSKVNVKVRPNHLREIFVKARPTCNEKGGECLIEYAVFFHKMKRISLIGNLSTDKQNCVAKATSGPNPLIKIGIKCSWWLNESISFKSGNEKY